MLQGTALRPLQIYVRRKCSRILQLWEPPAFSAHCRKWEEGRKNYKINKKEYSKTNVQVETLDALYDALNTISSTINIYMPKICPKICLKIGLKICLKMCLTICLKISAGNLFKFGCRASTEYQVAVSNKQAPAGSWDIPGSRDFFKIPIPWFSKI